uniref:Elastin-like isoform X1 n=1 Tax=Geotrypetes seraphini TaxID=260995 RepID=A0A6P8PWY4_GEOSA|nr:elastin-like isoform X1 [Geotrypetes seraphini]
MEPSGRQSDSAEGDVAEISLLAGDSFSEDATQQVGRGIGEERIRPVRRSKTAALSAMAIAGLGGTRGSVGLAGVPGNKVGLQAVASSGPGGAVSAGRSSSVSCVGGASVTAFLPGATSAAPVALEMSGRVAEDAAAASSAHIGSEGGLGSLRDGVAAPMHRGMGVLDSCGSPHVFGVGRGMDCFSQGSVPVGGASTSWAGVFPGSWGPGWGSPSWGPGSSVSGVGPSVSQWGGSSVGPMAMGILPSCSYGTGWGVPLGMGGSILPGPASLFSWSPQMPAFLPGGRESGVSDVGAARAPERPGGSGSERSSAFGGEVAAGGGATGSSHLSSSLPGVAVRGVSASGPVSSSGNAVRGISSGGVVDQGSSSQGSCGRSYSLWIVGHSFIHWASERAAIRPGGRHLGLSQQGLRVSWWGQRGMRWSHLLLLLERLRSRPRHPDLLLLHLGGNDVDACSGKDLVNIIKDDLRIVLDWFPGVLLIWSDIVPRPRCLASRRWTRGLSKLNRQVGKWVVSQGGLQILHEWVDVSCAGLFHKDGVHLSAVGWDLLLDDFASVCERVLALR